jgi:predicted nucleotidyltransferase
MTIEVVEKKVIIHKKDLGKLLKGRSLRSICLKAGLSYHSVWLTTKGYRKMNTETWNKLKKYL